MSHKKTSPQTQLWLQNWIIYDVWSNDIEKNWSTRKATHDWILHWGRLTTDNFDWQENKFNINDILRPHILVIQHNIEWKWNTFSNNVLSKYLPKIHLSIISFTIKTLQQLYKVVIQIEKKLLDMVKPGRIKVYTIKG